MRCLLPLLAFATVFAADAPAPLRVFLRCGPKTHGPGDHDHPAFARDWQPLLTQALAESREAWRAVKESRDAAALPQLREDFIRRCRVRLPSYENVLQSHAAQTEGGCSSAESTR